MPLPTKNVLLMSAIAFGHIGIFSNGSENQRDLIGDGFMLILGWAEVLFSSLKVTL